MPQPAPRATLVFMHPLGGSARTWKPVEERLAARFPCLRLDLPGFGDNGEQDGLPVAGMADRIEAEVSKRVRGPWLLVGHSMSAKVALLIARRAQEKHDLSLAGLVLAAGSPPAPEPMEEDKRREMLGWFAGDAEQSRQEADGFVRANLSATLDPVLHDGAVRDVLRGSRHAWDAWLRAGSREDLREEIGTLSLPALVLAGADDEALGGAAQREHMLPHLSSARLEIIAGAAHLLPLEQPDRVAELLAAFADGVTEPARITRRTASLLEARGQSDDDYRPQAIDAAGLSILRRLIERVLPMPDGIRIDLAAKLDAKLAEAVGDGWRFASLPPDTECYRRALLTLEAAARQQNGNGFASLDDDVADALLDEAAQGTLDAGTPDDDQLLPGSSMKLWLQEVRGDACQIFLTHPGVQVRAGLLAAATGGDAMLRGFNRIGVNQRDPWEDEFRLEHA